MKMDKPEIIQIIEQAGFKPRRKGKSFWLSCPFHEDRTPSMKIDPEKQTFFCFGCQTGGDSISFIQKHYGLSFKDACKHLNLHEPFKINSEAQKKKTLVKGFREWETTFRVELTDFYRDFHAITRDLQTWEEVEDFEDDFNLIPLAEYFLEILTNGTDQDKYNLYKRIKENE